MRHGFTSALVAALFSLTTVPATAQVAALSRTPDGRPNLQGIWQVLNTAAWDIQDHQARLGVPAGQGVVDGNEIPYTPAALAKRRANLETRSTADPEAKGYLPGVPRIMYMPFPFQVFQTPGEVVMVFEYDRGVRNIYTNGTPHPRGPLNWWMGDSRGRWDGNTLVIDTTNFSSASNFRGASENMHLVERYTPTGPDHINYEVTIDDPNVFTKPWTMRMVLYRRKELNLRLLEYDPGRFMDEAQAEQDRRKVN
jgi:hypothetical protein